MRMFVFAAGAAVAFLVSGCSIHPLPEDVTGVSTYHIVRQIRCEARDTLKKIVIKFLRRLAAANNGGQFEQLAWLYESDPSSISTFHYNLFRGPELVEVRAAVKTFYDAGIAYNFELTMTEDNNLSTEVDFIRPIVNPKLTLALTGGASRKRTNDRTFTSSDTFSGLLKLPEEYCRGFVVGPNYVYPIAGRVGVDAVISDFIDLTLFADLGAASSSSSSSSSDSSASPAGGGTKPTGGTPTGAKKTAGGGTKATAASPPTLADKLTFTTSITGSVNPVATFTPIGRSFQVSGASLTGLADRVDTHSVTVAVAIAPSGMTELASLRSYLFSPSRVASFAGRAGPGAATSVLIGNRVIGGGSPSERLALIAADQLKSREFELVPMQ
jgi:hypothetical protein